jgi:hypothetical protein
MLCGSDGNNKRLRDVTGVKMRRDSRSMGLLAIQVSLRWGSTKAEEAVDVASKAKRVGGHEKRKDRPSLA